MSVETGNAVIVCARVYIEERVGGLVSEVQLEGEAWSQALPSILLYNPNRAGDCGGRWVYDLLTALGADSLCALTGRVVRYRRCEDGMITAIGHAVKDRWFDVAPKKEAGL